MGKYLEETILSVVSQNYPNLEYIIIDGGSTDESIEIIKKYENKLTNWESCKDEGQYDAINKGFKQATGEILTYLNGDDTLCIRSLFTIAEIFSKYQEVSWIGGLPNHIDESGRCVWVDNLPRWNKYRFYNKDYKFIQQEGTFWRRSLWEKAGAYVSIKHTLAADLELWCRFFQYSDYYVLPILLGSFRVRSSNQRSLESYDAYITEADIIINELKIPEDDLMVLKKYNSRFEIILRRIPFIKRMSFLRNSKLKDFPKVFNFNRITQSF